MEEILIKLGFRRCSYAWTIYGSGIYAAIGEGRIHVATDRRPGSDEWAARLMDIMGSYDVEVQWRVCEEDVKDIHYAGDFH